MNNIDKQYQKLLQDIIDNGVEKKDRTGTGTISVFGRQIRHKMSEGFPLLTTKKMAWKTLVTELLWFLRGDTNIKYLVDNGCHIWDGDAYKNYTKEVNELIDGYMSGDIIGTQPHIDEMFSNPNDLTPLTKEEFIDKIKTDVEFAKKWGELGPVYGEQWRSWEGLNSNTDQIANLINDLKNNPDSRRLMVNAWNVGELNRMVLPPCHYGFQVYTRELNLDERIDYYNKTKDPLSRSSDYHHVHMDSLRVPKRAISLMWNQRSVDTFLGLPFNIASYGLLLEIIAKEVNMVPDELIGNLGDVHLYSNHIEQAKEQIGGKYSHEEREEMLKNAMGPNGYEMAIKDLAPFGGGMSEYYEIYKIPYRTREPYKLPTLNISRTLFEHGKPNPNKLDLDYYSIHNFELLNYESHPTIKAPLSN
jgi:thymidylate synthase